MARWMVGLALCLCVGCTWGGRSTATLQARLRVQAQELANLQTEQEEVESNLAVATRELAAVRQELLALQSGARPPELTAAVAQVTQVRISSWQSGGLNRNDTPGDDTLIVHFTPLDPRGEPVRLAGAVTITVTDPANPSADQPLLRETLLPADYQDRWTRGIAGAGYQLQLPWSEAISASEVVVNLKFEPGDGRRFATNSVVQLRSGSVMGLARSEQPASRSEPVSDTGLSGAEPGIMRVNREEIVPLPDDLPTILPAAPGSQPVGLPKPTWPASPQNQSGAGTRFRGGAPAGAARVPQGEVRDSTNWTESNLPVYR